MIRILRANLSRLMKNKFLYIAMLAIVLVSLLYIISSSSIDGINGMTIMDRVFIQSLSFGGLPLTGFVFLTFASVFLGHEYSTGAIRNKLVVGRSRTQVYIANFLTMFIAGLMIYASYFLLLLPVGLPVLGGFNMPAADIVMHLVCGVIIMCGYASFVTAVSMISRNKTAAIVISIMAIMVVAILTSFLYSEVTQPDMITTVEIVNGEHHYVAIDNPHKPGEIAMAIYKVILCAFPTGQGCVLSHGGDVLQFWHLMLGCAGFIAVTFAAGLLIFRKIDLK